MKNKRVQKQRGNTILLGAVVIVLFASVVLVYFFQKFKLNHQKNQAFSSCNDFEISKQYILNSFGKQNISYDVSQNHTPNPVFNFYISDRYPYLGFQATDGAFYNTSFTRQRINETYTTKISPAIISKGFIYDSVSSSRSENDIKSEIYRRENEFLFLKTYELNGQNKLSVYCGYIDNNILNRYHELLDQDVVNDEVKKESNRVDSIRFEIWEDYDSIIYINIGNRFGSGSGRWFYRDSIGNWKLIFSGQVRPPCDLFENYNAPSGIRCEDLQKDKESVTK